MDGKSGHDQGLFRARNAASVAREECSSYPSPGHERLRLARTCAAAFAGLAMAIAHVSAFAIGLVEFTFGTGTGTDQAQSVAEHLQVTPVVGRGVTTAALPHSFVDLGSGNMAMLLLKSDGGYRFDFTLSADPGYTFQVTGAHFAFKTQDTAGVGRDISVWPNADAKVTWYNAAGGDATFTNLGPGGYGWKTTNWNAFVTRTDLQTLTVQLILNGNSPNSKAIFDNVLLEGNVLAVPEPSMALLMGPGVLVVAFVAARRGRRAA